MVSSSAHHLLLTGRDGWFLAIIFLVLLLRKTYSSCPAAVCDCTGYSTRKTIRCNNRDLTDVPLGLPADTKNLRLEYNSLTKLAAADFMNLSQLEKLYLYNNQINVIEDGAFRGLSSLVHLQLTSNSISEITNETFAGAPKLEKLDLRNNHLSDLPSGAFSQVPLLSYLDLAANNLNEFPADVTQDLANLKELDLSENPVTLAPSFGQQLRGLEGLRLKNIAINAMGQFPVPDSAFDGLVNLTILELRENNLTEIPQAVKSLPNLITIILEDNLIRNVKDGDFHDPSFLQNLYLNENSLVEVPTSGLSKLPQLVQLELDYNLIATIPARAFRHNTQLELLSLNEAGISSIDKDAFQGLQSLVYLRLYGNNLTTIVDGVFDNINPALQVVLTGNPLLCDCNLRAFGGWLKNNTFSSEILKCAAPERLQGTEVVDLEPEQFACEPRLLANTIHTTLATQGTDVPLPCGVEADPIAEIYWITNNHSLVYPHQPKPRFYFLSGSNGTLMVTAVSLTDQGSYTCVVKNSAGEMSNSITLDVSMPMTPSIQDPTLTPVSGESVMVLGISGGVIACVVVLVLITAIVVYRNRQPADIQKVPLPQIPQPRDGDCDECINPVYAEIPHNVDANGYTTCISFRKQPSEVNPDEETSPVVDQHVVHTYLDHKYKKNNNNQEGKVFLGSEKCAVDLSNESDSQRYTTTTEQSNPAADQNNVQTYLDPKSKKNCNSRKEEVSCRWVKGSNAVELSNKPRYSTTGPSNQNGYMTMKPLPHQESK